MRQYCIEALAYDLSHEAGAKHIPLDHRLKQMLNYGRDNSDLFVDYFRYLREHEGEPLETPASVGGGCNCEMDECRLHRHAKDEECYNGKPGLDVSTWSSKTNVEAIENFSE